VTNTVIGLIQRLAEVEDRGVTEYDRRGRPAVSRSYAELHRRVRAAAAALRTQGVRPGEAVFLQLPNSCELVECFLGALVAGAQPCCLAPPRALGGLEAYQRRLATLFEAFPSCHLIAREETGARSGQAYTLPPECGEDAALLDPSRVDPADIAFLQLTSGTSRAPKAVRISHGALSANVRGILDGGKGTSAHSFVSWLPLYHDMGLVGMLFCALQARSPLHLFRPETFVARPLTWLKMLGGAGGPTITTAPNFAYQHCVDTVSPEAATELDLSAWDIAGCGAERVRPETIAAFIERFAPAGFRAEAFVPCYGMAETTLAVTFDRRAHAPNVHGGQVSCGRPLRGTELAIRGEEGQPVPDGEEGEITVRGPGLFSGYAAETAASPICDGWLHTGDLGLVYDGELYVTGRIKDIIIIDGENLDPDEIEAVAERTVRTPGGRCGAFPVEVKGRERVVLAVEVPSRSADRVADWSDAISTELASLFGFRVHDLVFVSRGDLPTTSSGKVRRAQLRVWYETGELKILGRQGLAQGRTRAGPG
jgi:fatty-acyl-CoA synthase